MVSAWYMDNDSESDQRLEHQKEPSEPLDMQQVSALTGVLYWKVVKFFIFFKNHFLLLN